MRKIKSSIIGTLNHYTIEELCNSIKLDIKDYTNWYISYKNLQNIIIISTYNGLKNLDHNINMQFGVDFIFKIIPNIYKSYKLMTIYYDNREDNATNIASLICIKYIDSLSLEKLF